MGASAPPGAADRDPPGDPVLQDAAATATRRTGAAQRGEHQRRAQADVPDDAREGLRHVVRLLDGAAGLTRVLDAGVRLPRF